MTAADDGVSWNDPADPTVGTSRPHDPPTEPTGEVDLGLRAARYWITVHRPYYSRALFACRLLVTADVDTMTIDQQWRIYANPDYVGSLNVAETAGLIIHNLNHALRDHAERAQVLSIEAQMGNVWQAACDCEIDDDLAADGLTLPEDLLFPYMFDMPNGRTAERYHHGLIEGGHVHEITLSQAGIGEFRLPSCGSAATGFVENYELDDDGVSDVERQLLRRSVAEAVRDHSTARGRGSVPAGLRRWADAQMKPKVDWRKALASTIRRALHQRAGAADYSWRRPPRRQNPHSPLQHPGMIQPVPSVAVVIDTSGSMTRHDLAQAMTEIEAILIRVVPGHAIRVLSVDAEVATDSRVFTKRQLQLTGGGGTDMRIGITQAAKSQPAAIVVITDGHTLWPASKPRGVHTVIAALVGEHPPTGRVPGWIRTIEVD